MKINQFFSLDCEPPPNHKKTPTNDGTFTLESEQFTENCHSTAGAYEETLFNYVHGTELQHKIENSEINIFEVGFGLGIGPIATFNELKNYNGQINFYSSELDENLVHWFKNAITEETNSIFPFSSLELVNEKEKPLRFVAKSSNRKLEIFIGDLIQNKNLIEKFLKNIHAIYQDPFSPKKNPTLWTTDWFKMLKNISHPKVVLSTYSASHSVHENLKEAGWHVLRAPGFAHKRSSTRATLTDGVFLGETKSP